jgi:hypothetical protein
MEWMRKYGGWIMMSLVALSFVARWLSNSAAEKERDKEVADMIKSMRDRNNILNQKVYLSYSFDNWNKREKGNDSDTLLIPYYDSLIAANSKINQSLLITRTVERISERSSELKSIALKYRSEKLLVGTWDLIFEIDPTHPKRKIQKIKSYTFFGNHNFFTCENGYIKENAHFIINPSSGKSFALYLFHKSDNDSITRKFFHFSNDSLIFVDNYGRMSSSYIRRK